MRTIVYVEDHQGYYDTRIVFETDSQLSTDEMRKISYEPNGAGRISTPFSLFKTLMEKKGYVVNRLEIEENETMPIVKGATGNY